MGFLGGLIGKVVGGVRTLVTNARVGKQVLAQGGQVTQTASGTTVTGLPANQQQQWFLFGGIALAVITFIGIMLTVFRSGRK